MDARNGRKLIHDRETVALPAAFLDEILPAIDDLAELKVATFCFAALQQKEGDYRFLRFEEFLADERLRRGLAVIDESRSERDLLEGALRRSVARGTLLLAELALRSQAARCYTIADERGRALHKRMLAGEWRHSADGEIELLPARPTIYGLYEDNIGLLTPMMADALKEAAASYPPDWIEEAMRLAVESNKRNWRYIRAILERWRQEGRGSEKRRRPHRRRKPY